MNNTTIQPYEPDNHLGFRRSHRQRSRGNNPLGPRCPLCNSGSVQPFSSIYGFGTTQYRTSRGLFIPHGFERTRRQSVMAEKCAPPHKMPWWPSIFSAMAAISLYFLSARLVNIADLLASATYWMLWGALALGALAAIQNFVLYPSRMASWGRKFLCKACGTTFVSKI